jgi:hypothetical protein
LKVSPLKTYTRKHIQINGQRRPRILGKSEEIKNIVWGFLDTMSNAIYVIRFLDYAIDSIKEFLTIDAYIGYDINNFPKMGSRIHCSNRISGTKTNGFMMSNSIPNGIYSVKFLIY